MIALLAMINKIQEDDIGYYWKLDTPVNNKVEEWKKQCLKYCQHLEKDPFNIIRDLCINMNNHQNTFFHQFENFLNPPLAVLGVNLKNFQINKICHFANHPYLCKGLN